MFFMHLSGNQMSIDSLFFFTLEGYRHHASCSFSHRYMISYDGKFERFSVGQS